MIPTIGLIGVPSSAGAHWPGQEKAPVALRDLGLLERLEDAGLHVDDHGDLPRVRFRPDKRRRYQQNLAAVARVAAQVADRVEAALRAEQVPLVLGETAPLSWAYWPAPCAAAATVNLDCSTLTGTRT